jgi:hypothetical protein
VSAQFDFCSKPPSKAKNTKGADTFVLSHLQFDKIMNMTDFKTPKRYK